MVTEKTQARTETLENAMSIVDPHSQSRLSKEDLEYTISMLKMKLQSTRVLSEKIRLYNQIKTLQDNISKLTTESSARS